LERSPKISFTIVLNAKISIIEIFAIPHCPFALRKKLNIQVVWILKPPSSIKKIDLHNSKAG
jgi:hypothetical protein